VRAQVNHAGIRPIHLKGDVELHPVILVNTLGILWPVTHGRCATELVALELHHDALQAVAGAVPDVGVKGINLRVAAIADIKTRPASTIVSGFGIVLETAKAMLPGLTTVRRTEEPPVVSNPHDIRVVGVKCDGVHIGMDHVVLGVAGRHVLPGQPPIG